MHIYTSDYLVRQHHIYLTFMLSLHEGRKALLPENTPVSALPAVSTAVMSADRVKHVVVSDFPTLLATLQMLTSTVSEKHTLLLIYGLTPLLMTQKVGISSTYIPQHHTAILLYL